MSTYTIFTDSGCDLDWRLLDEWGVKCADLTFKFESDEQEYANRDMELSVFYKRMRAGEIAKTAAVNIDTFEKAFRAELEAGNDIFYIGFSSGISSTSNSGILAADSLREEFPDRTIIALDTLCASGGSGLLVYLAKEKRDGDLPIEELSKYIQDISPYISHWYTVDDLVYLKRGGRVSASSAFVAGALDIRPVMHVDDEGKLENVQKVRGRRSSIKALAKRYLTLTEGDVDCDYGYSSLREVPFCIIHADCPEDAKALDEMICAQCGKHATIINEMGPVIGSHAGPGTLAIFFLGTGR